MANLNEAYTSASARRALKIHKNRIDLAESVRKKKGLDMSYERKLLTAQTLENTARQIKVMESVNFGATQPSNIGQYKRYAMDMVATLMPNLIAPDLVSTQALDNRVGMVNILQFQYGSDKGSAVNGQTFASPLAYQGMNESYTSSSVDGEELTAAADGKYYLAYTPVREGSVRLVKADGTVQSINVVDIDTGELATGATDGDKAYYIYDNETVAVNAPMIKMDIKSYPITTRSRKLRAVWAFDAAYELEKEYGQNMQDLLATQSVAEMQQEIDNEIMSDLYRIANAGPQVTWSRIQPVGVAISDHYDSFWNKIVEGSNEIFAATRRARANWMVCGLGVDAVVKCMRNFVASEDLSAIGPHFIGTLGGTLKVYVNPNFDPNVFVLGYKGPNLMDAGYVYAPYMPITTTGMVTLADDFASREGWATMYGKKAINPRLYVKGRIDG